MTKEKGKNTIKNKQALQLRSKDKKIVHSTSNIDWGQMFLEAKEKAKNEKLLSFSEIVYSLGLVMSTAQTHWPKNSPERLELEAIMQQHRVNTKSKIRRDWENSTPQAQKYLYQLLADEEERRKLSTNYNQNENNDNKNVNITLNFNFSDVKEITSELEIEEYTEQYIEQEFTDFEEIDEQEQQDEDENS